MVAVTPERRSTAEGIHAEMMPTANPIDDLAMHNRIDPYWDSLWAPGSTSLWATGNLVRARKEEDLGRKRVRRMLTTEEAMLILTANRGRTDRHAAWGVLQSWRTMSAEQLAAFTGSRYFLDPDYSQIAASFALELIDIGRFANYAASAPGIGRNTLYRPSNSDSFTRFIEPTLTGPELLSVTACQPWSAGGQYDRHNMLAAELGLRAAEYLPRAPVPPQLGSRRGSGPCPRSPKLIMGWRV